MTPQEITAYNLMIRRWSAMVRRKLVGSVLRFTDGKEGAVTRGIKRHQSRTEYKLKDNISYRTHQDLGQVDGVGYQFERHGVFVHKGVGRGYVIVGDVVVPGRRPGNEEKQYAKSQNREAKSIILAGPSRRKPAEWFNPVLDQHIPELADKVAQMNADATVNAMRMRIV
ncbi:MAG: hypothetical protein FD166_1457 [Bacteroidetes bacterium]|nr:MAG: hypothetical protein FD166_1457 [Bacteroidota bacterium]